MRIDENLCIACGSCVLFCPMGAISVREVAVIDLDECVECGVCYRAAVCPVDAFVPIVPQEAEFGRALRAVFSDPTTVHAGTGVAGRGTEEMKTNEVTGRFKVGRIGLGLEFGRPGIGTRLKDVDTVARALAPLGVHFEPKNPVTQLMEDVSTGALRKDVLNEKVMSAIIEAEFPIEKTVEVLDAVRTASKKVDTVFSVECINVVNPDGSLPLEKKLAELGIPKYINGKTNVALGRKS